MAETTVHASRSIRPLRFGFVINPSSKVDLKKAIGLYTCQWGSKFNAFIPLVSRTPSWWCKDFRPSANKILSGYLSAFEPDYVVATSKASLDKIEYISDRKILYKEIWSDAEDTMFEFGLSSVNLFEELYQKEFKFVRRKKAKLFLPKARQRTYDLFVASCFGYFPDNKVGKIHKNTYLEVFEPEEIKVDSSNYFKLIWSSLTTPLSIGSYNLERRRVSWSLGPTLFVLDASKPEDIIDFWNLRASGWTIIPIPIQWSSDLIEQCADFIKQNHVPLKHNPNGIMHETSILGSRKLQSGQLEDFINSLRPKVEKGFIRSNFPRVWDNWARDKDHASRCTIVHEDESVDAKYENGELRLPTLKPNFEIYDRFSRGPSWASTIKLSESFSEITVPQVVNSSIQSLDTYMIASPEIARPDTQEGLVHCANSINKHAYLRKYDAISLFQKWFNSAGEEISISPAGRTSLELIRTLGGLRSVRKIAHYELITILNEMAMGHIEEPIEEEGQPKRKVSKRSIPRNRLFGTLKQIHDNNAERAERHLKQLVDSKVVQIGYEVQCTICESKTWYSLSSLNEILKCDHCLQDFEFPSENPPKNGWHYRALGPFSTENYARGSYVVALTLNHLVNTNAGLSTWVPSMKSKKQNGFEYDFAIWKEESDFGVKKQVNIFGECKTHDEFESKDITRMKDLANLFPGSILVFATLKESLSEREKRRIKELAYWGRKFIGEGQTRAPVLILTRHELLEDRPIPYCWKDLPGARGQVANSHHIHGTRKICEATQREYLGAEPFFKWHEKQFAKKRKKTKKKK